VGGAYLSIGCSLIELQIPPLRCAPVGMTKERVVLTSAAEWRDLLMLLPGHLHLLNKAREPAK
jgi:hypothetical protein